MIKKASSQWELHKNGPELIQMGSKGLSVGISCWNIGNHVKTTTVLHFIHSQLQYWMLWCVTRYIPDLHSVEYYSAKPLSIYQTIIMMVLKLTHHFFSKSDHIFNTKTNHLRRWPKFKLQWWNPAFETPFVFHPACTFFNLSWTRLLSPPASGSPHVTTSQDNKLQTALHKIGFLKGGVVLPLIFPNVPSGSPIFPRNP